MSRFSHGPWYAMEPFAGFSSIKQAGTDALIFGIAAGDPDEKQPDDVCEANAHLIAAAPELYEALEGAVAYLETLHSIAQAKDARAMVWKRLKAANAALAKARGEVA